MAKMTISEVRAWLETAEEGDPYFLELRNDSRAGVRKLLASYARRMEKKRLELERHLEKERFDAGFRRSTDSPVAGVDEAGRGPLAGPVVTAAVILPPSCPELAGLDDSKAMSREARERLAEVIRKHAVAWSVHVQPAAEIDRLNIYRATRESMERAVAGLSVRPDAVIADAMALQADVPCHPVVKADAQSLCVAAASVLAKTERDAYMDRLHEQYPAYGFCRHAGYSTAAHLEALKAHGPCPEHRKTFAPVAGFLVGTSGKPVQEKTIMDNL
ncbi:Ribonuclease HII [Bhargavaea cecembensis DSE10]|uniref:Ribonuclease HII n=2 Tax=Bhargavaea cecembensis TaxID=394098 RepID=M7NK65_9BACL|nr:Ribonuclease HII [Bhargavaea cecembensis DSE10]